MSAELIMTSINVKAAAGGCIRATWGRFCRACPEGCARNPKLEIRNPTRLRPGFGGQEVARNPNSKFPIPKGLCPPAQGWRACEPTLRRRATLVSTATRLWPLAFCDVQPGPQPRCGWEGEIDHDPR